MERPEVELYNALSEWDSDLLDWLPRFDCDDDVEPWEVYEIQDEFDRRADRDRVRASWECWRDDRGFHYLDPDDVAARRIRVRWHRARRDRRKARR